ncbi:MAG: diacylglycerol kinase family lipid kinase [Myxococcales bacterium]|nr:diacylglycerol kinase family lipid kinase [Myxococcales bacterium]
MGGVVVILNTAAGGGRAERRLQPWLAGLGRTEVRPTSGPGHATVLARNAVAEGADAVVAAGGDGTVHEVLQGLLASDERPRTALGILPLGTGNSFVKDVGLDDLGRAAAAVGSGNTREVDVVRVEHAAGRLWSLNIVSVGFAADAGALTNAKYKPWGVAGYVAAVVETVADLRQHALPHALDEGDFDARPFVLLSFCNSSSTGGDMKMAPAADVSDGELDVVRIAPMRRRRFLSSFPRIFRGTHGEMPEITMGRARSVRFAELPPTSVMIDGEVVDLSLRSLKVLPRAVRLLVP